MKSPRFIAVMILSFLAISGARAETLSSSEIEALQSFYTAFNGDDWHKNDGWLEPGVAPCDWHGVECDMHAGQFGIVNLELPANNLVGDIGDSDIFDYVLERVELQDNRIRGTMSVLPVWLDRLDLSDNRLTGPLPDAPEIQDRSLRHLDLARNRIEGAVPGSWEVLFLEWLDLSNNELSGTVDPLADALGFSGCSYINLADNALQGEVPAVLMGADLCEHEEGLAGGGINLCWNDLNPPGGELGEWLASHQVGGDTAALCLDRSRQAVGPDASGSFFDPARDGEGAVVHVLPDGRVVHYTFGFDNRGRQHWLLGVGQALERNFYWPFLVSERGSFGEGAVDQPVPPVNSLPPAGFGREWRMDRVGNDRFVIERTYLDFSHCIDNSASLCVVGSALSDRLEYERLSQPAGTTCGNQASNQAFSGAWYDPDRDGEGFVVEVLADGRAVVYWFTFRPGDSQHQAWMMGVGRFEGQTLVVDQLVQPVGGQWGDNFDPADVMFRPWGSLTLEFTGDDAATVTWDSEVAGFGTGGYVVQRLSRLQFAECDSA